MIHYTRCISHELLHRAKISLPGQLPAFFGVANGMFFYGRKFFVAGERILYQPVPELA
jgi:hypothetical protein